MVESPTFICDDVYHVSGLTPSSFFAYFFFFFKQKTAYEILSGLVGSEMCIRDRLSDRLGFAPFMFWAAGTSFDCHHMASLAVSLASCVNLNLIITMTVCTMISESHPFKNVRAASTRLKCDVVATVGLAAMYLV